MSIIRISFFLPNMAGGGTRRVTTNLANCLAERSYSVDLVLVKAEGEYLNSLDPRVRVIDLGASRTLTSVLALSGYIERIKPRVLMSTMDYTSQIAILSRNLARTKVRLVFRQSTTLSLTYPKVKSPRQRLMNRMIKMNYPKADALIAASAAIARELKKFADPRKVHLVHNPINIDEIRRLAGQQSKYPFEDQDHIPTVISVGRLTKAKNYPLLLEAFNMVIQDREAKLMILGEGEERSRLEKQIDFLGLRDHVFLLGFLDNPFPYMVKADVLVLSSLWEGLPNVLLEALALGKNVVATDCPSGPREILQDGKYGRLVPTGDAEALSRAIVSAIDSPLPRNLLEARAKEFDLNHLVDDFLRILDPFDREIVR